MTFTLPDFDGLSHDQDDVLALPLDESAIVLGPPGSGKTIMALYRAKLLHGAGRPTLLLMYNRLLSSYTKAAIAALSINSVVDTYHRWFRGFWLRTYRSKPPKIDKWNFDWAECKRIILSKPVPAVEKQHIIVDEGQDMPRDFYLVLRLVSRSMLIFADENQRITEHQSTIRDIQASTGIQRRLVLRRNQRNTPAIARFASHFHVGLPSGVADPRPAGSHDQPPVLVSHPKLHQAITYLVEYEKAHSDETIGVLLPLAETVRQFHNRLNGKTRNPVQLYLNQQLMRPTDHAVDLSTPGIKLVTWASCKGLEFDSVFLPELQTVAGDPNGDDLRMKLYVACTRARRKLTLMYTGDGEPTLVKSLPLDLLCDRRDG